jgi:two-component system response regulator CpxR
MLRERDVSKPEPLDRLIIAQVELNFLNRSVLFFKEPVETTGLEFNLLTLLMCHAGSLITREDIAEHIFKRSISCCDKSINSHMANLRKKLLGISSCPVIKTIKGRGYIFLK